MSANADNEKDKSESAAIVQKLLNDWENLNKFFGKVETEQQQYLTKLNDVHMRQETCAKNVRDQKRQIQNLKEALKKLKYDDLSVDDAAQVQDLMVEITEQKSRLDDMNEQLPHNNNGLYLNIILGHINVSLTNKMDKFRYKDEYEKFKITVTLICMIFATASLLLHFRVVDAAYHFLLVWYYCTLTIRESILRANGSRIKGWWVAHHYLSAVLCGVLLTWPDGACYQSFRMQFIVFSLYLTLVQLIQCQYQRGCLYRLRTLGKRHSMDITIEGFHSWMFRGLTFVLPFLILGYVFQLYNAYTLFVIWRDSSCRKQWQILVNAILFLLIAIGNSFTTGQVCWRKLKEKESFGHRVRLQTKYMNDSNEPDAQDTKQKSR